MKRFVIYSAMVGAYDEIKQPLLIDERFDYVLFSNDIQSASVGVWQVRKIEYTNPDNTRICRYVKTHPGMLLPGYDFSVWMDSNVQICTDYIYRRTVFLYESGIMVSSTFHIWKDCIYAEAFQLMYMGVEHEEMVINWCHRLRREGYPQHNGLCETSIVYRVSNTQTKELDTFWWNCIDGFSRRDQLSFNYSLWKYNIPVHYLMGIGKSVRNMDDFSIIKHLDEKHNDCPLKNNEAWLIRYVRKHPECQYQIERLFYHIYDRKFPSVSALIWGQVFRMKHLFIVWREKYL